MAELTPLTDQWVDAVVSASEDGEFGPDRPSVVALTIGKSKRAVLQFENRRVSAAAPGADDDVDVTVPFTAAQLEAMTAGRESMAQAYIRGDLKPVGSTGAFLALIELFESGALHSLSD